MTYFPLRNACFLDLLCLFPVSYLALWCVPDLVLLTSPDFSTLNLFLAPECLFILYSLGFCGDASVLTEGMCILLTAVAASLASSIIY